MVTLTKKFDDKVLKRQAEIALAGDPTIAGSEIVVSSKGGLVTLTGRVRNSREHQRALDVVRRALDGRKLKYGHIVDDMTEG